MSDKYLTIDGNEAVANVAHRINEVIAIYPITPSSNMGEWADQWSADGQTNIWGTVPTVIEMQSEGGAAGAVHGALQAGALTTTFTASQGLLLMIPNMYKIAGELTPGVIHVAARSVAAQALSIFGDHSDVMATRATGFGLLASGPVQEAHDFAVIAQAISLASRVPFVHFFDGFRTSHEVQKISELPNDVLAKLISDELTFAHRARAMTPDRPVLRGTAQNPDVFFQARETVNPYYAKCPDVVAQVMDQFYQLTGRRYDLFQYHGAADAERVVVLMGSAVDTAHETVDYLNANGEKVGVLKVRLYRPFDTKRFIEALPASTKSIAVLDRTKEPGAQGEPLYLDCVHGLHEGLNEGWGSLKSMPTIVGGRYGLSSKEFTAAMVKGVFDNLSQGKPKNHFTVGIEDDLSNCSLPYDKDFSVEPDNVVRAMFFGLGSDGTVGANKNSIKIIGEGTDNWAQGYFVYDSKKAGATTVSHLRFGPKPIRSIYLVNKASFVACHQTSFLEKVDMLKPLTKGGTFLLNTYATADAVWDTLPQEVQQQIIDKDAKLYIIDAYKVAKDSGMGRRINTVMQVCFFAISGVLPRDEAIAAIKDSIKKTYGIKGQEVVEKNYQAVDNTLANLHEVSYPKQITSKTKMPPPVAAEAPEFVQKVTAEIIAGRGDDLPTSLLPNDGTYPTDTAQWDKRNIALEIPVWEPDVCIQCGKCAMVCPHAAIRQKVFEPGLLADAPAAFKSCDAKDREWKGLKYSLQVAPEDCTGCTLCVDFCPAKNKKVSGKKAINMEPQPALRQQERESWNFFLNKLPEYDRTKIKVGTIKHQQLQRPLFEFSGACAGCGETPYVKLASQLFGDRMLVANATGCSSIYGGNLPTTPWAKDACGRGPTWSNSLFEDNAEFGLGFRLTIDQHQELAKYLVGKLSSEIGDELAKGLLEANQRDEAGIFEQRERVEQLKKKLAPLGSSQAKQLLSIADMLARKSVWIMGGDGWAYDIGYGGLDHVLASGRDVNVLVLDTEVYSNTGGQMSKATPRAAVAKFAAGGKPAGKKDLGLMAMSYGNVYVASVAMGARDEHTLRAFLEAEAYEGPSLIIAYSHCIAHGIDMAVGMQHQKAAVEAGQWLLYRYNPALEDAGENPLKLDSKPPKMPLEEFLRMENRFNMLTKSKPEHAKKLFREGQQDVDRRFRLYQYMAARTMAEKS